MRASRSTFLALLLTTLLVLPTAAPLATAQEAGPGSNYRIGARDLLDIRVFDLEDLNTNVRVSEEGTITLPLIGEIVAQGLTSSDLQTAIETALKQYVNNPQVQVFIREYSSQRVSVIGAVKSPGTIEMQGRLTLLEVLSEAGGIDYPEAAGKITILRTGFTGQPIEVDIEELITRGNTAFNLELEGGDTVNVVPKPHDPVYIYGRVRTPGQYTMREPITLLQAIAMAGGLADRAQTKVMIQRRNPQGGVEQIEIDINDIIDGKTEDIRILPNDVIVVKETFF